MRNYRAHKRSRREQARSEHSYYTVVDAQFYAIAKQTEDILLARNLYSFM